MAMEPTLPVGIIGGGLYHGSRDDLYVFIYHYGRDRPACAAGICPYRDRPGIDLNPSDQHSNGSSLSILFALSKFNPLLSGTYRLVIFNTYSFYMPTFLQPIDLKEYFILTKSCKFNNLKKCSHVIVDLGLSISY
jgi:hypothetical protein